MGDCLVSWVSKKQRSIVVSIIEAKSIVETTCCTHIVEYKEPLPLMVYNTSAIRISKDLVIHSKTRRIQIKYHFLREQVVNKVVKWNILLQMNKL